LIGPSIIRIKKYLKVYLPDGSKVQGFNFVVPVNTVKEFVNQAGAKNKLSNVDKLYKKFSGLNTKQLSSNPEEENINDFTI